MTAAANFTPGQAVALAWVFLTGRAPRCRADAERAIARHWRLEPFTVEPAAEIVSAAAMGVARHHPMTRAVRIMQGRGFVIDQTRLISRRIWRTCKRIPMVRHGRSTGETPADNVALVDHKGRLYQRGRFLTLSELERGNGKTGYQPG